MDFKFEIMVYRSVIAFRLLYSKTESLFGMNSDKILWWNRNNRRWVELCDENCYFFGEEEAMEELNNSHLSMGINAIEQVNIYLTQ